MKKKLLLLANCLMLVTALSAQTPVTLAGFNFTTTRQYNGTRNLSIANVGYLVGVATGDTVGVTATGLYASASAGTNIAYTITFALTGPQASLYALDTAISGNNGVITPRPLGVTGTQLVSSKEYTGGDYCPMLSAGTALNRIQGDRVTLNASARFVDVNAGTNKEVVVTFSLSGAEAANYTAPDSIILTADITPKPIHITGTTVDTTKVYNGSTVAQVLIHGMPVNSDLVLGDTVMPLTATANYLTPTVGAGKTVVASYTMRGPQAGNYVALDDSTLTADITPRLLSFSGVHVRLCKEYDGTTEATVLYEAFPTNLVEGDSIAFTTHANYDTPEAGANKTITVHYSFADMIVGPRNYSMPEPEVYSTEGKIVMPTILNPIADEAPFAINSDGLCQEGIAQVVYSVQQGEPKWYTISFSEEAQAEGFANIETGVLVHNGDIDTIAFPVPAAAAHGTYYFDIFLTNEADVNTDTIRVPFTVNYPSSYMTAIFEDVISIVNTENLFLNYQWYHNNEAIEGATKPYYQEDGKLWGSYFVEVNKGEPTVGHTCALYFEATPETKGEIEIHPNPINHVGTVQLTGFANGEHIMRVYNAFGQQVYVNTFAGDTYTLDLTRYPEGVYLVTVDGVSVKAMKKL